MSVLINCHFVFMVLANWRPTIKHSSRAKAECTLEPKKRYIREGLSRSYLKEPFLGGGCSATSTPLESIKTNELVCSAKTVERLHSHNTEFSWPMQYRSIVRYEIVKGLTRFAKKVTVNSTSSLSLLQQNTIRATIGYHMWVPRHGHGHVTNLRFWRPMSYL